MNIVQNNNSSYFYDILNLESDDLKPFPFSSLIDMVFNVSNEIWKKPDLENYPDHSVKKHSKNILKYFLKFNSYYQWTDIEKVVFSVSCMIHDIGMQYRSWGKGGINSSYSFFPDPCLITNEEIRSKHCKLGWDLIDVQLHKEYNLEYPQRFCIHDEWHEDILNYAADIAFSHSSSSEILPQMIEKYKNDKRILLTQSIRPLLLVAMMILCDELDGNCQRIENPQEIGLSSMDTKSQKYWLSNLFVNDVGVFERDLSPTKGFVIQIQILLPINIEDEKQEIIKQFIKLYRIEKIRSEIDRIKKILSTDTIPNVSFPIYADKELIDNGDKTHFKLNDNYWEIIKKSVMVNQQDLHTTKPMRNSHKHEDYSYLPAVTTGIGKSLIEWFFNNLNKDHYLLNSGVHTNYLINCRSIIQNQELLNAIAEYIRNIYLDSSINNILAIGTSAIPIAVNSAVRLNTDITFTMAKEKTGPINPLLSSGYTPLEVIPITTSGGNLLIIDDIISSGKLLNYILDEFNLKREHNRIYHFALFKLGSQKIELDKKIDSKYILEIPFIEYYESEAVCPMCQNKEDLIGENTIGY